MGYQESTPPVNVGDEIDVKIEAVGAKGDGIARKDGFVLFIPGVKEGDQVRVKVTKVLRKVGFAEVAGGSARGEPAQDFGQPAPEPEPEPISSESIGEEEEPEAPEEEAEEPVPEPEVPPTPEEPQEQEEVELPPPPTDEELPEPPKDQ